MLVFHRLIGTWAKQVDVFIALTGFARRKFIEGGLPTERIVVKPNFVHPDPGMKDAEGEYAVFVGRLSEEKGVGTLLRAWRLVGDIPLKIAGDGPLSGEARRFVNSERLRSVDILGRVGRDEVIGLMKGARLLVCPSGWYEGFPLVLAEAFACGLPVVTSRLGAMEEIVEDGRTGLQFKPGDQQDLAAKVEWAWAHPDDVRRMGREARAEFERKYTAERNYDMLIGIYARAFDSRLSGRA